MSSLTPHERLRAYRAPANSVQWRAGAVSRDRKRAQALPYVDPRHYEGVLDDLAPGWSLTIKPWGERRVIAEVTIDGVTRSSTGEFDDGDKISQGTTAEAQAFKRACARHGLLRYLYEIPIIWVDYNHEKRRLLDTPELSGRFVPRTPASRDGTDLENAEERQTRTETPEKRETLSHERAVAMSRELEKLGLPAKEQRTFAAAALGRRIGKFTELTDGEALEVWNAAKRAGAPS